MPEQAQKPNPYEAPDATSPGVLHSKPRRWPYLFWFGAIAYYAFSALSLPFAHRAWFGEVPVLAIFQIPKSIVKSVAHDLLLYLVHTSGWSRGSASPDYGMTHGWAMLIMVLLPPVIIGAVLWFLCPTANRRRFLIVFAACALIDGLITFWFDSTQSLKLYNTSFF